MGYTLVNMLELKDKNGLGWSYEVSFFCEKSISIQRAWPWMRHAVNAILVGHACFFNLQDFFSVSAG